MLKKSDVPATRPLEYETVNLPGIGEVMIRGASLAARLTFLMANSRGTFKGCSELLAACIFVDGGQDKDGKDIGPVEMRTSAEWEAWGGESDENALHAMAAYAKCDEISDMGGEQARKNLKAQPSDSPAVSQ